MKKFNPVIQVIIGSSICTVIGWKVCGLPTEVTMGQVAIMAIFAFIGAVVPMIWMNLEKEIEQRL